MKGGAEMNIRHQNYYTWRGRECMKIIEELTAGVRGLKGTVNMAEVMTKIYNGDCLDLLPNVPDESMDLILCDLPYGITHASWDKVIDPVRLWKEYRRIIKPHGCIALFSMLPFSIDLITPARDLYRYEWIWKKTLPVGFLNANRMPLRIHENVLIFYKALPKYHPIKWQSTPYGKTVRHGQCELYGKYGPNALKNVDGMRYPVDVLTFSNGIQKRKRTHPTGKPLALLEYMIKTYTDPGDTVLDNTMGTGGTGIAAARLNRKFIGIEKDEEFFNTALSRIVDEVGAVDVLKGEKIDPRK